MLKHLYHILFVLCSISAIPLLAGEALKPPQTGIDIWDMGNCCFTLAYSNDGSIAGLNGLEVNILSPGVTFSTLDYELGNGWFYSFIEPNRHLSWTYQSLSPLPVEGNVALFQFCLSGWSNTEDVLLECRWKVNAAVRKTDRHILSCVRCVGIAPTSTVCWVDSSYIYNFNFTNTTAFPLHELALEEPPGQDWVLEESLELLPPLQPGQTREGLSLSISNDTPPQSRVCFDISARQQHSSGTYFNCCTAGHCIVLPKCDYCCNLPFDAFEQRVANGFEISTSATDSCGLASLSASPLALDECERVIWTLENLGSGTSLGGNLPATESIRFDSLDAGTYVLCMQATRSNTQGEDCYNRPSETICDTILLDCISAVQTMTDVEQIRVFPNPSVGSEVYFECPFQSSGFGQLTVTNALGQEIVRQWLPLSTATHTLFTANWPPGVYTLWIIEPDRHLYARAPMLIRQ